jgi:hypothetical protein
MIKVVFFTIGYSIFIFLQKRRNQNRLISLEFNTGATSNISKEEIIFLDLKRIWILAFEKIDKNLIDIYYNWDRDYKYLKAGEPIFLKQYKLKDVNHFLNVDKAIKESKEKIPSRLKELKEKVRQQNSNNKSSFVDKKFVELYTTDKETDGLLNDIKKTNPDFANALKNWEPSYLKLIFANLKIKEKHKKDTADEWLLLASMDPQYLQIEILTPSLMQLF